MQHDINFEELAIATGISANRLKDDISTYGAMSEIFPVLEASGHEAGLFGGTALNKVYFGKQQRLSYDLDIFAYSYTKTLQKLEEIGAKTEFSGSFPNKKGTLSTRMSYKGIVLDVVDAKSVKEKPIKLQAYSILYYYGQLVPPITIPSYSLEYLLAQKTIALLDRNELKDIYDMYTGIMLLKDIRAYKGKLAESIKQSGISDAAAYSDIQIKSMLKNSAYYENKRIDIMQKVTAPEMLREIKRFFDTKIYA